MELMIEEAKKEAKAGKVMECTQYGWRE